jgi:DNA/RNA-binding domain of Phe-tRNA-synthetase-like protein
MRGVANPEHHAELERRKAELEEQLRARFAGHTKAALAALPSVQPYAAYYGQFKKTYHVLLQLESVALKGKPLPRVAALVEAMFMAELKNQLLTAGHDLDALREPLRLDVARGDERYTLLNGKEEILKAGDMFIADAEGVTSGILYGPDQRTRLTPDTRNALFTVYAPPGVGPAAVHRHLQDIRDNVWVIAPEATVKALKVFTAEQATLSA